MSNNDKKFDDYNYIVSFTKRFGKKIERSGFEFWEYNDGEFRIFVQFFFKTSSFIIIESKTTNNSTYIVYYKKTNLIKFISGTEKDLSYASEKTGEVAPIKDLLKLR